MSHDKIREAVELMEKACQLLKDIKLENIKTSVGFLKQSIKSTKES